MITKKKTNIPIFDYNLTIVIFDNWEEVKPLFKGIKAPGVTTFTYGKAIVAINSKSDRTIIHESEHIKNLIWEYIGYTPQSNNDEVDAYLIAYIYDKIAEVFYRHRI